MQTPCRIAGLIVYAFTMTGCVRAARTYISPDALPDTWRTHAERTDFEETGRHAETIDFCRRLATASPCVSYTTFGATGEGRELPLLILSSDRAFTPAAARRSGKPLILIQNCIHAGECEGKDACLALARDIAITGVRADLLAHVNVLILPIFNADGHERFGAHNRINQNGPREMGWRTNAVNLNLNRDYTKADAIEMQAWLRLWNAWQPDLFIDDHTTDGHSHRYDLFYAATTDQDVAAPVATWVRDTLLPGVLPALAAGGHVPLPYSFPRDAENPAAGMVAIPPMSPRLSTGYVAACNRPALLVETHALLPYGRRVRATYDFLVHTLETVNRGPDKLLAAVHDADNRAIQARGAGADGRVPLRFEPGEHSQRITYYGLEQTVRDSEITGGPVSEYTNIPRDVETDLFDEARIVAAVTPPAAYLIPPQWTTVIERLALHGVRSFRLQSPQSLDVESYRFEDVKFSESPYESRQMARYQSVPTHERRSFVPGTVVVPLNQPRARLIVHLLEPDGPDSFVAWGFFNAIFEQKEYFEAYIMEPIAQQMLARDPALKTEFDERFRTDETFAKDPGQRLDFFYRRSPYWDQAYRVYPVARLMDADALPGL